MASAIVSTERGLVAPRSVVISAQGFVVIPTVGRNLLSADI